MSECKTLPASLIALGHCVIVNRIDQPCGRLVAVITEVGDVSVRCKYLNSESELSSWNLDGGMSPGKLVVTPVNWFNVEVRYEESDGDIVYWCQPVGESIATYSDGEIRRWQEYGYRGRYVARPEVFKIAQEASQ